MEKLSFLPGFRFHPTDVELVCFYLKRKIYGKPIKPDVISELDIYKFAPWDLPGRSCLQNGDLEWYFFCPRDRKYANGPRTNRATELGYWKTTGKDRSVCNNSREVGMKKTLVFHMGKAPHGDRTNWVMHEYRLEDKNIAESEVPQDAFVLCRIFEKSGPGPKNGEQYGAPFKDEDWNESFMENLMEQKQSENCAAPSSIIVQNSTTPFQANFSLEGKLFAPGEQSASQENPSAVYDVVDKLLLELVAEGGNSSGKPSPEGNKDDVTENINNLTGSALEDALDTSDVYFGLEDIPCLVNLQGIETIHDVSFLHDLKGESELCQPFDQFIMEGSFLELNDFQYPMNVATSRNSSCVYDVPQASNTSFTNMNAINMPSWAGSTLDAASNAHCLFKDMISEGSCVDAHSGKESVMVIQEPFSSMDHGALTSATGEGHGDRDNINNASNDWRSVSVLESLLDYYPARPALAAEHQLAYKGGSLDGNMSTHSCVNASTLRINHAGTGAGSSIYCSTKCERKVGTAMPWRGFFFMFLISSASVVMWILLLVLGFKFFRCVWKLNSYVPKF